MSLLYFELVLMDKIKNIEVSDIKDLFKKRDINANKGDFGKAGIYGVSIEYSGALKLSYLALTALRSGCGISRILVKKEILPLLGPNILEETIKVLPEYNSDFYNKIGYYSDNNMGFYNSYVLLDSLFGIKYYSAINKNKYYELIDTKQISALDDLLYGTSYIDNYLYRNPYALNLGYMVSNNVKTRLECNNGFECQNKIIKLMTNIKDDIYQVEEVSNEITITSKNDFYLLVDDSLFLDKSYKICIEKKCFDLNATSNRSILVENNYEIGDKLNITFGGDYNIDHLYIGYFDFEKFEKAYDKLKDNQLNITYFKENHIKGNVNVNDENVLFLTIPYNENFKILVDGQESSYYKVFDQFIGLDLENGTHDIEIIYEVKGLKLGIIISLTSLILFIIYTRKHL